MHFRHLAAAFTLILAMFPAFAQTAPPAFGTYLRPYAADSLWNSRPVAPVLGAYSIPKNIYFPGIGTGAYSTGVFLAGRNDASAKAMTVYGLGSTATVTVGVADPDIGGSRVVTVPRWPAGVIPATGTDGHADIVDERAGVIHSFWRLKQDTASGKWTAALYSWSQLNGSDMASACKYVGRPSLISCLRIRPADAGMPTARAPW